jgi:hypothetical protein
MSRDSGLISHRMGCLGPLAERWAEVGADSIVIVMPVSSRTQAGTCCSMDDEQLVQTLLDLEHQGWKSLCDGTADAFYGRMMTEDAQMILANGQVMNRSEVVSALADAPPWTFYELRDVRMVRTGADGAALVYIGSASRESGMPPFVAAMASVYVSTGDDWKLALYQQTPVDDH